MELIAILLLLLSSRVIRLRAFAPVRSHIHINVLVPARVHQKGYTDDEGVVVDEDPRSSIANPARGYEWTFKGRAMLRPCLQRIKDDHSKTATTSTNHQQLHFDVLSLFGWTLGGRVALQYDVSPAANGDLAYNEFVVLGCLGICEHGVGQVGRALYVNETDAVELCDSVWDLGAQLARIDFQEEGGAGVDIQENQNSRSFQVRGWSNLRSGDGKASATASDRNVRLDLLWTPTITGIWFRPLPWWPFRKTGRGLPVHRLRVSGKAKLQWAGALESSEEPTMDTSSERVTIVPFGVDIILQNALIEISTRIN
jgi:hypothetical protein